MKCSNYLRRIDCIRVRLMGSCNVIKNTPRRYYTQKPTPQLHTLLHNHTNSSISNSKISKTKICNNSNHTNRIIFYISSYCHGQFCLSNNAILRLYYSAIVAEFKTTMWNPPNKLRNNNGIKYNNRSIIQ